MVSLAAQLGFELERGGGDSAYLSHPVEEEIL